MWPLIIALALADLLLVMVLLIARATRPTVIVQTACRWSDQGEPVYDPETTQRIEWP